MADTSRFSFFKFTLFYYYSFLKLRELSALPVHAVVRASERVELLPMRRKRERRSFRFRIREGKQLRSTRGRKFQGGVRSAQDCGGADSQFSNFEKLLPEKRKRLFIGLLGLQRSHIDGEAVLHISLEQSLVSFVDLLDRDDFDIGGDVVLPAEVEHLLGFDDTADR
jgi:hypothetical protein